MMPPGIFILKIIGISLRYPSRLLRLISVCDHQGKSAQRFLPCRPREMSASRAITAIRERWEVIAKRNHFQRTFRPIRFPAHSQVTARNRMPVRRCHERKNGQKSKKPPLGWLWFLILVAQALLPVRLFFLESPIPAIPRDVSDHGDP